MIIELKSIDRPGSPISYETLLKDVTEGREYTGKGELLEKYKPVPKQLMSPLDSEKKSFWVKMKEKVNGKK